MELARIAVMPSPVPPELAALDILARDRVSWGALRLVGHSLMRLGYAHAPQTPIHPGDAVQLILFWRREGDSPPATAFDVALEQGSRESWVYRGEIGGGTFSAWEWQSGQIIRDIHEFVVPADLSPGAYWVVLRVAGEASGYRLQKLDLVSR